MSAEGKARAEADERAARDAGWAPKKPIYATGRLVNEWGIDNADKSRRQYDDQPLAREALTDLVDTVRAEKRADLDVSTEQIKLNKQGQIVMPSGETIAIEQATFNDLVRALDLPPGAGSYLSDCDPELRAWNVNQWTAGKGNTAWIPKSIKLRTRIERCGRTVYAVVSDSYATYDVDQIAHRLAQVIPADGRGEVIYDGRKFQADVLWHSDVKPEKYVAGEFFKTGLRFRSDDTGGGSCNGSALLWRNLCLNLVILDIAERELFRLRHFGNVGRFRYKINEGIREGLRATEHFRRAWGYAVDDQITPESVKCDKRAPSLDDLMWGVFLAEARRTDAIKRAEVPALVRAWQIEPSATRAGVANAITRHAQTVDPFRADDLERYAGSLLLKNKKPFGWVEPETRDRNALYNATH